MLLFFFILQTNVVVWPALSQSLSRRRQLFVLNIGVDGLQEFTGEILSVVHLGYRRCKLIECQSTTNVWRMLVDVEYHQRVRENINCFGAVKPTRFAAQIVSIVFCLKLLDRLFYVVCCARDFSCILHMRSEVLYKCASVHHR